MAPMQSRSSRALAGAASVAAIVAFAPAPVASQPQQQPQRIPAPKWLDDEGRDLFNDIETDDAVYSATSCEARDKLLRKMAGHGEQDAGEHRARVLLGLGICEFQKGDYNMAKKRMESCISELNVPSEDWMLQQQHTAHFALFKQASSFMQRHEVTQASTALRRCREIVDRNLKKMLKFAQKQISQQAGGQAPPLEAMIDELPQYGKTGQYLPMLIPQMPVLKTDLAMAQQLDTFLDELDKRMAGVDPFLKDKRIRLSSKSKTGSLLYVRALTTEAVVPGARSAAAQELVSGGAVKSFMEEAAKLEKGGTLVKRGKDGSACKEDKGFSKTCKAVMQVADVASNAFGETRALMVKAGKPQQLDACTTNANVGILVASGEGVRLAVKGGADAVALTKGEPQVVDFCRELTLTSAASVPVLFAQAWHPEFAAVERTTELRARAKSFSLSEDDVKAVAKVINDNAKKSWDKSATLWRKDSEGHRLIQTSFSEAQTAKKQEKEAAEEARRAEEAAGDEEKKAAIAELEKKREAKRKAAEEAEQARLKRKKQLEEEKRNRDPWLNAPAVVEAENKLAELKEARRDANAKLEFDLSTSLTKEISAAERALKKEIKKARKAHKRGDAPQEAADAAGDAEAEKEGKAGNPELEALQKELEAVKAQKKAAAEEDNFKEAKVLKKKQTELEDKIKKLEL